MIDAAIARNDFVDSIDLREYLIACLAEPGLDYLQLSFEMMVGSRDGLINDKSLIKILRLPFSISIDDCYNFYDQLCPPGKRGLTYEVLVSALIRKPEFHQLFEA
uniref:Uncharacterized protein n=1 Tax=Romanomermis culicivorax TaxID=13658 RepID=A0A915L5Z2_ROMCU